LATDEAGLQVLSRHVGTVVAFVVETASGCADFRCFENGLLRRRICNVDGQVTSEGSPLPEEAGIDGRGYYMRETEILSQALGVPLYDDDSSSEVYHAICVVDRTDYEAALASQPGHPPSVEKDSKIAASQSGRPQANKKPWWRIW
jgi:hypothetical protein